MQDVYQQDDGSWLQQNDVTGGHVRWGHSASQSTASNSVAVMTGRKKSREYLM